MLAVRAVCRPQEGDEDGYEADVDGSSPQGAQPDDDELSDDGKSVSITGLVCFHQLV